MYITMMLITGLFLLVLFWLVPLITMGIGLAISFIEDGDFDGYEKPDWLEWVFDKHYDIIQDDIPYAVVTFFISAIGGVLFPLTVLVLIGCCVVGYLRYKKIKQEEE